MSPASRLVPTLPLDGECWEGHVGRLAHWNHATSPEHLRRKLQNAYAPLGRPARRLIDLAAEAAGSTLRDYAQQHSLSIFHWEIPFFAPSFSHGSRFPGKWSLAVLDRIRPALLCPECAAEDVRERGYSYWRRWHQIPGVHFCIDHGEALLIADDLRAFWKTPGQLLGKCRPSELADSDDLRRSAFARKYSAAARAALDVPWPYGQARQSSSTLIDVAASKGYRIVNHRVSAPPLSKGWLAPAVLDCVPACWLDRHYPQLLKFKDYLDRYACEAVLQILKCTAQGLCMLVATLADTEGEAEGMCALVFEDWILDQPYRPMAQSKQAASSPPVQPHAELNV